MRRAPIPRKCKRWLINAIALRLDGDGKRFKSARLPAGGVVRSADHASLRSLVATAKTVGSWRGYAVGVESPATDTATLAHLLNMERTPVGSIGEIAMAADGVPEWRVG